MQDQDQRVVSLANKVVELLRNHQDRYEALEAVAVARALFRPVPKTYADETISEDY